MCDNQYDVSNEMKEIFERKQKQRLAAKQYYRNLLYNPHRPTNDGMPFDPALQRFHAWSLYHVDYYKPKGKYIFAFLCFLAPAALTFLHVSYVKEKEEKLLRSGQVKYSDRPFKLIF